MAAVDCTVIRSLMQSPRPGWSRAFSFLRLTVNTMAKSIKQQLDREKSERLPVAGATWQVWTADEDEDRAADAFARRHGSHPEHVVDFNGYLWLGPVPGQEGGV